MAKRRSDINKRRFLLLWKKRVDFYFYAEDIFLLLRGLVSMLHIFYQGSHLITEFLLFCHCEIYIFTQRSYGITQVTTSAILWAPLVHPIGTIILGLPKLFIDQIMYFTKPSPKFFHRLSLNISIVVKT